MAVINIPIEIDDHMMEEKIQADYDRKFESIIFQKIDDYICKKNGYGINDHDWGMQKIIDEYVDRYFNEHKDEFVDLVTDKIAARAGKYKRVKEALK